MPNIQSKPLVQSTIDIYEARTSQGHLLLKLIMKTVKTIVVVLLLRLLLLAI